MDWVLYSYHHGKYLQVVVDHLSASQSNGLASVEVDGTSFHRDDWFYLHAFCSYWLSWGFLPHFCSELVLRLGLFLRRHCREFIPKRRVRLLLLGYRDLFGVRLLIHVNQRRRIRTSHRTLILMVETVKGPGWVEVGALCPGHSILSGRRCTCTVSEANRQ